MICLLCYFRKFYFLTEFHKSFVEMNDEIEWFGFWFLLTHSTHWLEFVFVFTERTDWFSSGVSNKLKFEWQMRQGRSNNIVCVIWWRVVQKYLFWSPRHEIWKIFHRWTVYHRKILNRWPAPLKNNVIFEWPLMRKTEYVISCVYFYFLKFYIFWWFFEIKFHIVITTVSFQFKRPFKGKINFAQPYV